MFGLSAFVYNWPTISEYHTVVQAWAVSGGVWHDKLPDNCVTNISFCSVLVMTDPKYKVAIAHVAPVFLEMEATVDKACSLISLLNRITNEPW